AGMRQGHNIVVMGAGGLGLYATAFAVGMGARNVIAMDGQKARLELAKELGATATIDIHELTSPEARVERVMDVTHGRGADITLAFASSEWEGQTIPIIRSAIVP